MTKLMGHHDPITEAPRAGPDLDRFEEIWRRQTEPYLRRLERSGPYSPFASAWRPGNAAWSWSFGIKIDR